MTRFVTVFGATGNQGSSVVNALLVDGTFTPRAVTRNLESDAAKKLKAKGVEVVRADLNDKESIRKAVADSECVFGVTQPYDSAATRNSEVEQGKNLIDACKEADVKFFVWSSLESSTLLSKGKYTNIHHRDNKFTVEEYLRRSGLPHANIHNGVFAENMYSYHHLTKASPGGLELSIPRVPITQSVCLLWAEKDLGPSVLAILKNYKDNSHAILGQSFVVVSERITYAEFVKVLEEVLGKQVTYRSAPTSGLAIFDEMWDFVREFGLYEDTTVPDPRLVALGVKFSTIRSFVEEAIKPRFT